MVLTRDYQEKLNEKNKKIKERINTKYPVTLWKPKMNGRDYLNKTKSFILFRK